ncbi:MAG: hypothetical protein Kow0047_03800 [Anaerolineae bacterium]
MDLDFVCRDHLPSERQVCWSERRWLYLSPHAVLGIMSVVAALFFGLATVAQANGAPVTIFLDYLPDVSNWGPTDATGRAVVAVGEGEVELVTRGLPRLSGEHYQVWLERADTGDLIPIGGFNPDAQGKGELHVILDQLPYTTYRTIRITVEPTPDPDPAPSGKVSLVGRFPNPDVAPEGLVTPGAVQSAGEGEAPAAAPRPQFLPVTGAPTVLAVANWRLPSVITITAIIALAALWYLRRSGR